MNKEEKLLEIFQCFSLHIYLLCYFSSDLNIEKTKSHPKNSSMYEIRVIQ